MYECVSHSIRVLCVCMSVCGHTHSMICSSAESVQSITSSSPWSVHSTFSFFDRGGWSLSSPPLDVLLVVILNCSTEQEVIIGRGQEVKWGEGRK